MSEYSDQALILEFVSISLHVPRKSSDIPCTTKNPRVYIYININKLSLSTTIPGTGSPSPLLPSSGGSRLLPSCLPRSRFRSRLLRSSLLRSSLLWIHSFGFSLIHKGLHQIRNLMFAGRVAGRVSGRVPCCQILRAGFRRSSARAKGITRWRWRWCQNWTKV